MEAQVLSRPLDEVAFIILDVETTGLNPHFGDRVCEIALLRCQGGRELDRFLADLAERGVSTLEDLTKVQEGGIRLPEGETIVLPPQIEEALRCEGQLELSYVSASGRETRRVVSPLRVAAYAGHLYLIAVCHLRNQQRTFRLDRIIEIRSEDDSAATGASWREP